MAVPFFHLLLFRSYFLLLAPSPHGDPLSGAALVKEVCAHTSDFSFCFHTLSSDPLAGTPQALAGELAIASLRLAQARATDSGSLIDALLANASSVADLRLLQACQGRNNFAVSQLSMANNDFNSDTVDAAVEEVNAAANATLQCKYAIPGSALVELNSVIVKLCEICVVSTKYLSPGDFDSLVN